MLCMYLSECMIYAYYSYSVFCCCRQPAQLLSMDLLIIVFIMLFQSHNQLLYLNEQTKINPAFKQDQTNRSFSRRSNTSH